MFGLEAFEHHIWIKCGESLSYVGDDEGSCCFVYEEGDLKSNNTKDIHLVHPNFKALALYSDSYV